MHARWHTVSAQRGAALRPQQGNLLPCASSLRRGGISAITTGTQPMAAARRMVSAEASSSRSGRAQPRMVVTQQQGAAVPEEDVEVADMAMSGSYDASINASVWERRPVPVIARCITIGLEFLKWHFTYPDDPAPPKQPKKKPSPGLSSRDAEQQEEEDRAAQWSSPRMRSPRKIRRAAAMRELLVRLGPAFVKIGQALSSRPDILPPSYLVELEALQDRIPAFDNQLAFQVLEQELGAPVRAVFKEISPRPVAAASLGQVYRAVLQSGQVVAVKVQRPGVAEAIALDVFILRWLAAVFRKARKLNTDLPALVDEWATSLFKELDYRTEARNAGRFKQLYSSLEGVFVPEVLGEFTTAKVLTMEWVEGERLRSVADNIADDDRELSGTGRRGRAAAASRQGSDTDLALVQVGVNCSLEQMLEEGFYHADPHLGNLMRTKDGKLAYLDFGMCGELDQKTRQALIRATLHLVNREYQPLAQDFIDLGLLPPGSDKSKIVPALTGVFQKALSRGVSNLAFGDLSGELGRTMYQYGFRIPSYYTLLVRSLTVLEGIALASNPNYKVLGSAYPWIARRLLTNQTPELRSTLRALLYTPGGAFRFSRLESLLQEAVRTPRGLPPPAATAEQSGVGAGAGGQQQPPPPPASVSAATAEATNPLALLLSPDASFVRDILLDELAKGVDAGWRVSWDQAVHSVQRPLVTLNSVPVLGPWLVPLVAPLTTFVPDDNSATQQRADATTNAATTSALPWPLSEALAPLGPEQLEHRQVVGPAGQLLAALPQLSSPQDKQQVDGLRRLALAMTALAAARQDASGGQAQQPSSQMPVIPGLGALGQAEAQAAAQLQQAAEGLRWLVREVATLPPAQQQELLKLPSELASRVASRVAARALRLALAGGRDPEGEQQRQDFLVMEAEVVAAERG